MVYSKNTLKPKRTCREICKKFKVKKPTGTSRYGSGQAKCQICDIWIDHKGCHLKDGSAADMDNFGWFCNCCNYRVRRNPRNKKYKEKLRQSSSKENMDKTNELIVKALNLLKNFGSVYLGDMKRILSVSEEEIKFLSQRHGMDMVRLINTSISDEDTDLLVPRLSRIDGMTKKEIQHGDETLEILFEYDPPKDNVDESRDEKINIYGTEGEKILNELEKETDPSKRKALEKRLIEIKKLLRDLVAPIVEEYDTNPKHQARASASYQIQDGAAREQGTHDALLDRYTKSDISRSLYAKYKRHITTLDANIEEIAHKKFISLQIDGKSLVGITLQKSKITFDFKLAISKIDDPLRILHDISKVGSWTSGKTRMNVFDEKDLEYCINITKQCYDRIKCSTGLSHNESKQDKSSDHIQLDTHDEIRALAEKMINEHATNNRINKSLRRRLTTEFIGSKSMRKIIKDNPSFSKEELKRHVRTSLRLPDELQLMENAGHLHPDPECSLQIALFAVNHHDWDGKKQDEVKVTHMAQEISKCVSADMQFREAFSKKTVFSKTHHKVDMKNLNGVSTAVAVWIATATLHQQYGINSEFSNQDILNQVMRQNLINVKKITIEMHISSHCVANNNAMPEIHRKLYRVSRGRYRLYRNGDYYNRSRVGGQIEPNIIELPEQYKDLLRWYKDEFCSNKDNNSKHDQLVQTHERIQEPHKQDLIPKAGEIFTEYGLQTRFRIANMGGIRPSTKSRIIVLMSSYDSHGFENVANSDSKFITFVGQGQKDQTMTQNNKSLMMSKEYGYTLLYFNKQNTGKIVFQYPVEYVSYSFAQQKNNDGSLRKVILFNLKKLQ